MAATQIVTFDACLGWNERDLALLPEEAEATQDELTAEELEAVAQLEALTSGRPFSALTLW
jgi:hypothetical protein